ncbi:hypothetical protein [Vibrio metschnikovii]|uniref:Uncharacterized protein n=1 Tax=Vibrio metschnikovii TaxID=28172 RepID=A0A9X0UKJ7_VIBME|nr:hypothetical protein [Vibrio metschnikovii]MBC5853114.1 hypothetical protein [Vibrio metschnikovii]
MKKARKFIKIKLLIINLLVGTGAVHLKKHDPHIHDRTYRHKRNKDIFLVLKHV